MGIRFDGLATGLDTTALVDALLQIERRPLQQAQARESTLRSQQELFRDLNTRLLALRDAALAVDNLNAVQTGGSLDEEFLAYSATSEDETYLRAETTGNASPGEVDVEITRVAQAGREISFGFSDPAAIIASEGQTLQISVGTDTLVDYTVPAGGASLQDIAAAINADTANDGSLRAEILFDGTDHRLVVSSSKTGAANAVAITTTIDGPAGAGSPLFDSTLAQAADDAELQVFGLTVTRDSNDVTDLIPGVTLHLEQAHAAGESTTVSVSRDDETIAANLQELVDAYNGIQDFIEANASYDAATERGGPLLGDSTLQRIDRQLREAFGDSYTIGTNPFSTLSQVGLRFEEGGRLSLDAEVLSSALDEDPFAVRELLSGDGQFPGIDGAATAIGKLLDPITLSGEGTIATRIDGLDDQAKVLEQTIDRMERRLEQREETLLLQFSQLETLVSNLQAQGGFLQSAFASLAQQTNQQ